MTGGDEDVAGRQAGGEGLEGLGWGGSAGFDQRVSDVTADSFRGKLQGLNSLVSRTALL